MQKNGGHLLVMGVTPVASEIKKFSKDICFLDFSFACIRHYFPRRGRQTETAQMRVTGISPLRGSLRAARGREYHYLLTRSLRNSLSCCFVDGWVPLAALLGRLLCGETAQSGLGASSSVALRWLGASSGNVFQSPDMTGLARCFSRCGGR